jgi:hypothetical protein
MHSLSSSQKLVNANCHSNDHSSNIIFGKYLHLVPCTFMEIHCFFVCVVFCGIQKRQLDVPPAKCGGNQPGRHMLPAFGCVSLPACLPAYLPACLPAFLPSCLSVFLPSYLPAFLPSCLPACLLHRSPCHASLSLGWLSWLGVLLVAAHGHRI